MKLVKERKKYLRKKVPYDNSSDSDAQNNGIHIESIKRILTSFLYYERCGHQGLCK
jgi:hypothetical protein